MKNILQTESNTLEPRETNLEATLHSLSLSLIEPLYQDHHVKFPSSLFITILIKTPVIDFDEFLSGVKF